MTHPVQLRRKDFESKARSLGLDSQRKQAQAIGVHESIHSRAIQGQRPLSGHYVIGVLLALGDPYIRQQVADLFDVAECVGQASQ